MVFRVSFIFHVPYCVRHPENNTIKPRVFAEFFNFFPVPDSDPAPPYSITMQFSFRMYGKGLLKRCHKDMTDRSSVLHVFLFQCIRKPSCRYRSQTFDTKESHRTKQDLFLWSAHAHKKASVWYSLRWWSCLFVPVFRIVHQQCIVSPFPGRSTLHNKAAGSLRHSVSRKKYGQFLFHFAMLPVTFLKLCILFYHRICCFSNQIRIEEEKSTAVVFCRRSSVLSKASEILISLCLYLFYHIHKCLHLRRNPFISVI